MKISTIFQQELKHISGSHNEALWTRTSDLRDNIAENMPPEEMVNSVISLYVENISDISETKENVSDKEKIFRNSIVRTMNRHGEEHAVKAIRDYLKIGDISGFTRENDAKKNIEQLELDSKDILKLMISDVVEKEIQLIQEKENGKEQEQEQEQELFSIRQILFGSTSEYCFEDNIPVDADLREAIDGASYYISESEKEQAKENEINDRQRNDNEKSEDSIRY